MTSPFDFHTHRLDAPAGAAIISMPREWLLRPHSIELRPGCLYSAGIHPWWTASPSAGLMLSQLPRLLALPQVVAVGECGIDPLRGASLDEQQQLLHSQLLLANQFGLPVTLHVVRRFDIILHLHKHLAPHTTWTVHGFRGGAPLARQLTAAGLHLSFGPQRRAEAWHATPPHMRHEETDEDPAKSI